MSRKYRGGGGYRQETAERVATVQPPCIWCIHLSLCAREKLACEDYQEYTRSGRKPCGIRRPDRETFEAIRRDEETDA